MIHEPSNILIYHITAVENLPGILAEGGLHSDAAMAQRHPTVIGYDHIKKRRLEELSVICCGMRFVGEFAPFYFCPRSPMLYTINLGNTGRPAGCQNTIVHLVSTVAAGIGLGRAWAISDGNAGASYTSFYSELSALESLDWEAIRATSWKGRTHQKSAELLVADFFPWTAVHKIGCHNGGVSSQVAALLRDQPHRPLVETKPEWYY